MKKLNADPKLYQDHIAGLIYKYGQDRTGILSKEDFIRMIEPKTDIEETLEISEVTKESLKELFYKLIETAKAEEDLRNEFYQEYCPIKITAEFNKCDVDQKGYLTSEDVNNLTTKIIDRKNNEK